MPGEPQICRSGLLIKAKKIYAAFGACQPLSDATVRHSTQNNWIGVYVIPKKILSPIIFLRNASSNFS
ncbi:hypothetical protein NIES4075_00670 [Tolypothrix sp. NIES-4075]|nr:hypothetical protein NIES4075_00670 [Tolypothrix sp. NIES-4075]